MGLRAKLGLYVVLFVGAVLALVGYLRASAERDIYLEEMLIRGTTLLRSFAIPCAVAIANNDTPTLDNYVVQFAEAAKELDLRYMVVLDFEGRVAAHTEPGEFGKLYTDPFTMAASGNAGSVNQLTGSDDGPLLEIAVPLIAGLRWGTLRAGFTLTKMERALARRQTRGILTGIGVSLGAAALAYLLLSLLVVRPVLRMRDMARRFGSGSLDVRVDLHQKDEMGHLAQQLNAMASQIQGYTGGLEKLVDERTAELAETNDKLVAANKQLRRLARTDELTGLYNRRHFMEQLQFEIRRGQRTEHQFTVIMLDVDHFKHFNDTNGHTAGDELLQRLAALLEINLRGTDVVARYGGEEFIILLLDTGPKEGYGTAVKLQQVVAAQPLPLEESQPGGVLTVSVGVAFYPQNSRDSRELIELADQALYQSKAKGRNCVTRYGEY